MLKSSRWKRAVSVQCKEVISRVERPKLTPTGSVRPPDLVRKLLSRDPINFNSALNAYFDGQATYHGYALNIHGISQIKHAAWLWSYLNLGRGSDVASKDLQWNHKALTLSFRTTRHIRPIFLPLFTFAVPVKSVIKFQPTRDDDDIDHLYAVSWDDEWPLGHFLEHLPFIGFILSTFLTPLATYLFLAVSNFLFAINAQVTTASRHWTSPQMQQQYSQSVPASVKQGFHEGEKIAQGWGQWLLSGGTRAAHHPLQVVEWSVQTASNVVAPVLPFRLPVVSVFDPKVRAAEGRSASRGSSLNEPIPLRTQKTLSAEETHSKRTAQDDEKNPRGEAQHAETTAYELPAVMPQGDGKKNGIKKATVEVGESNVDEGHTIDVASQQFNDVKAKSDAAPRPDAAAAGKKSLYDQIDDSKVKKAEEAGKKAKTALDKSAHDDAHRHKQKKTKHTSDSSGESTPDKTSSTKKSSKTSGTPTKSTGTPTKKRKDHGA